MGLYLKRTPEGKYAWNHRSQTVGDQQQQNTRSPGSDRRLESCFWVVDDIFKTYGDKIS